MIEDLHTEFKEEWTDRCLRNIAAFGNTDGGVLFIGLNDKGEVVGVDNVRKLLKDIPDKIHNVLGIVPIVDNHSEGGKDYISIKVAKHDDVMFHEGKVFIKSGSTTRELKGRELRTYFIKRFDMSWTDDPCPQVTIKELDDVVFRNFKKKALDKKMLTQSETELNAEVLFKKLDLSVGKNPKMGAVLLFHPEPEMFSPGSRVRIGLFNMSGAEIIYQDFLEGPLFLMPDRVLELILTKYTANPISYEGIYRVEKRPYPPEALREAVLNSIIHSDYGAKNPIQIKVFPDRLMIFNEGSPPIDWTVETLLKSHESRPGNPSMATVFHRAGMVEHFGRGIGKILNEYKDRDVKQPVFKFTESSFNVTFFNENYEEKAQTVKEHSLSSTQMSALRIMIGKECSPSELRSALSIENRESFRRHVLKPLLELNLIEMTVKDKPNSIHQKYRLTAEGSRKANSN